MAAPRAETDKDETAGFCHLHVHTQYSILDGAASIPEILSKAVDDGMDAVAITDHGNMFGAKEFHNEAVKRGIKPILGCEAYIARRSRLSREDKNLDASDHIILLAKNLTGMVILLAITYFLEILIDNVSARMNWRWMLGYIWAMGLSLSLVNLIWLYAG